MDKDKRHRRSSEVPVERADGEKSLSAPPRDRMVRQAKTRGVERLTPENK
jgi:hypothetical protein